MLIKNAELKFTHIDKVDDNNKYSTAFFLSTPEEEQALTAAIEAEWENNKGNHPKAPKSLSYNEYFNDENQEDPNNGKIIFNASQNAESADGKYTFEVDVYDSAANKIDKDKVPSIGWGTKADLSISFYTWTFKKEKGVKLNLEAVQIIDLVEFSGGNPFEAKDSGFKAPTNPFNQPSETLNVEGV